MLTANFTYPIHYTVLIIYLIINFCFLDVEVVDFSQGSDV